MNEQAKARILIVDNEPNVRDDLRQIFEPLGFTVAAATGSGDLLIEEAEKLAKQFRPHVVIIDLRLYIDELAGDQSGLFLIQRFRSVSCILYSAYLETAIIRDASKSGFYTFVGKGESPQKLVDEVEQAVRENSASVRGAFVHLPSNWSQKHIFKALGLEQNEAVPTNLVEDILCQLFPENNRVEADNVRGEVITPQDVSRGRSVILKVYPDDLVPFVVKLGLNEGIRKEQRNYNDHVKDKLGGRFYAQLENVNEFWELGGAVYAFMGTPLRNLPSFTDFYRMNRDKKIILEPLRHFFSEVWSKHYQNAQDSEAESLFHLYNESLKLEARLESIKTSTKKRLFKGLPITFTDPANWILAHKNESRLSNVRVAVTHGDLHGDNLFVDGNRAWAIDFENTSKNHILRDFVELETDIMIRLSRLEYEPIQFYPLAITLTSMSEPTSAIRHVLVESDNENARKVIEVVYGLRQLASKVTMYSDVREYYWGLLFNILLVAKRMPEKSLSKSRALLFASIICERLRRWGQAWPPKEWPDVKWGEEISLFGKQDVVKKIQAFFRSGDFTVKLSSDEDENYLWVQTAKSEWQHTGSNMLVCYLNEGEIVTGNKIKQMYARALRSVGNKYVPYIFIVFHTKIAKDACFAFWSYKSKNPATIVIPIHISKINQLMDEQKLIPNAISWELISLKNRWLNLIEPYDNVNSLANPQWFFGDDQKRLVQELLVKIKAGSNLAVFGMRRIGKTTLINQVVLNSYLYNPNYPIVHVLCKPFSQESDYSSLLAEIVRSWERVLRKNVGLALPKLKVSERGYYDPKSASIDFQEDVQKLFEFMQEETVDFDRLILILDEVDHIFPNKKSENIVFEQYILFTQTLKSMTESPQWENRVTLIVVMEYPWINRIDRFKQAQNPLYGRFEEMPINLLSVEDWKEMVETIGALVGLEYEGQSLEALYTNTIGHPEITRRLCSCLVELRDNGDIEGPISPQHIQLAIVRFLDDPFGPANFLKTTFWEDPLSYDLNLEQRLLVELAKAESLPKDELLYRSLTDYQFSILHDRDMAMEEYELSAETKHILDALSRLRELRIITFNEQSQAYHITIPIYKNWIRQEVLAIEVEGI